MKKTVIFDLDGTLALIDERRLLASKPNVSVIEMAKILDAKGYSIVIFSGRDAISRAETIEWLNKYGVPFDLLKMKPKGSFTHDYILKLGWLEEFFPDKSSVLCAFDDRDKVVRMWRDNGIDCFQVAEGNF